MSLGSDGVTYDESPAVSANGTVRPSAKPMMISLAAYQMVVVPSSGTDSTPYHVSVHLMSFFVLVSIIGSSLRGLYKHRECLASRDDFAHGRAVFDLLLRHLADWRLA